MMSLTESQIKAVQTVSRQTLVVAGAGSGKTRVLTRRVLKLLASGADPVSVLVLTFTRKAATELRMRLTEYGMAGSLRHLSVGTFHSVCLKVLQEHGHKLGYDGPNLTVLDANDCRAVLRMACQELGILNARNKWSPGMSWKPIRKVQYAYETTGQMDVEGVPPEAVQCVQNYRALLKKYNAVDFAGLLVETNLLFANHPNILSFYKSMWKHVLVDELQDSDETQYVLHRWFKGTATFFGVGDFRQSIYGFRGARPELMFAEYPDAERIDLAECFRCGDRIVESANALADHETTAVTPMLGATGRKGTVEVVNGGTAEVCRLVSRMLRMYKPGDIALLGRSHRLLLGFQRELKSEGIPCYKVGQSFDITESDEFRAVFACLRLCTNTCDDVAFMRLSPFLMRPDEYIMVRADAALSGGSHFDAYAVRNPECPVVEQVRGFLDAPNQLAPVVGGFSATLKSLSGDAAVFDRVERFWLSQGGERSRWPVPASLQWYSMYDRDRENEDIRDDVVTLATIHAAKGLEWPVVILVGMNEGFLPSKPSIRFGLEAVAEERRVAYVAMTRAKERLYINVSDDAEVSRFVAMAGLDYEPTEVTVMKKVF